MRREETIRSASNPLLRRVRAVRGGRERGVLVLEGERLVDEAIRRGFAPEIVLVSERRAERAAELRASGVPVRCVADSLFATVTGLRTAPGILALVAEPPGRRMAELSDEPDALVVVVAGVQDPGNLGALARTAEAAGACALVRLPGACRPWNEKALRGSMGSLLRLPVIEAEAAGVAWRAMSARGFRHVVARTRGGVAPERCDWSGRVALWVSGETGELSAELDALVVDAVTVTIPMEGPVESLNVTAAAAVLLFSARRTREAT